MITSIHDMTKVKYYWWHFLSVGCCINYLHFLQLIKVLLPLLHVQRRHKDIRKIPNDRASTFLARGPMIEKERKHPFNIVQHICSPKQNSLNGEHPKNTHYIVATGWSQSLSDCTMVTPSAAHGRLSHEPICLKKSYRVCTVWEVLGIVHSQL